MRARRSALLLSLVVALAGTMLVASYVKHAGTASASEKTVSVLVAKARIPTGTDSKAVGAGLTQLVTMPVKAAPVDALTDLAAVHDLVALSDVYPGQVLVRAAFGPAPNSGGLTIPRGQVAVSVQLGDPQRVAGFVLPGSQVAILDTHPVAGGSGAGGQGPVETRTLFPRVTVIAVGPTALQAPAPTATAAATDKAVATTILTLAVSQTDAERLVQATQTGKLYFALLSRDSQTGASAGVNDGSLFR